MVPELGNFALILALLMAVALVVVPMTGATIRHPGLMAFDRPLVAGMFVMLVLSYACLTWSFMVDDFSVGYVANNSNSMLPWYYKFSAVWGGHEGSMLLWVLILGAWTLAVALFSRNLPDEMRARVLSIMGLIGVGFMLFTLITSNPFERMLPNIPRDGADLNPLLQDFGLIVHPPMLYMGYVGFSVVFAFAIASLLGGRLDAVWARWSRPWTTVAWAFLTLGIALGSWWAYYELGWGGWWFWDPVENASFMPWLVGTALIHSLAVTEKRGVFKSWTVLLAIMTFALSILGTFLVRSGVLTSVHAFATDPERGFFILMMLAVTVVGSLALYAIRAPAVQGRTGFTLFSREALLLLNNVFLVVATFVVLLGTIFPLILDYMGGGTLSVGEPYFNITFVPIALMTGVILGFGVLTRWKRTPVDLVLRKLLVPAVLSVIVAVVTPLLMVGELSVLSVIGLMVAAWVAFTTLRDVWDKTASRQGRWHGLRRLSRSYNGMVLGHVGLAMSIAGATMVSIHGVEQDRRMAPGDRLEVAGYEWHFADLGERQGPNFTAQRATFDIYREGEKVTTVYPEKRHYPVRDSVMTNAGISAGVLKDLFVALGENVEGQTAWSVRIQYKPMVRWIWGGALFMALGGAFAVSDRRYRVRQRQTVTVAEKPRASQPVAEGAAS
ncbi:MULTISPECIES: heme lyase CcmF/NrfE family subunit [Halomonadaceae]|uniref:Heme lyase CcmF/NrfE family subunit n=1 Tax=Vreelandella halophila TaxID=86177 RepID=A0A9X5B547_9GAMM|nr:MULTISPECIES: heme lyase CcmF/NrfE family subunit [Halomonas]MYL27010.1 heme lyase CcmF/NrfE family subunit [Halomonas utahensis]MYL75812.1 heme lyase CcmF/NrfE family subunit [Halomonas sp. 22501_18_FS]